MDKIKANGFWVGIGTAGAVIVALFAGWVLPAWSRQEANRAEIDRIAVEIKSVYETPLPGFGDTAGMPGGPDIAQWEARRLEYLKDYQNIASFYRGCDKVLERFFGDQPTITHDAFKTKHTDAAGDLERRLRVRVKVGLAPPEDDSKDGLYGFNWVDLDALNLGAMPAPQQAATVRDLQKRFRICEHVGTTCQAGAIQVERLCDVYFFRQIGNPRGGAGRPGADNKISYEEIAADGILAGLGGRFEEPLLPENGEKVEAPAGEESPSDGTPKPPPTKKYLGQVITFGLAVNLPITEVPRFIAELISCRNSVIVNVVGARVMVRAQNKLVAEPLSIQVPDGDPKKAEELKEAARKAEEAKVKPQNVQLQLLCQVVDFDEAGLVAKLLAQP